MRKEEPNPQLPDWEKISWEKTPYPGIFLCKIAESPDPANPDIPFFTIMALKMEPQATIPPHRHKRDTGWMETITLPNGGFVEIQNDREIKQVKAKNPFTVVIEAGEIFGLKNMDTLSPLYFLSQMKPGFTGYREIEEVERN